MNDAVVAVAPNLAPAKINLALHVTGTARRRLSSHRKPRGFHRASATASRSTPPMRDAFSVAGPYRHCSADRRQTTRHPEGAGRAARRRRTGGAAAGRHRLEKNLPVAVRHRRRLQRRGRGPARRWLNFGTWISMPHGSRGIGAAARRRLADVPSPPAADRARHRRRNRRPWPAFRRWRWCWSIRASASRRRACSPRSPAATTSRCRPCRQALDFHIAPQLA